MIHIAATSRTTPITPASPAPGGDPAAFGLSLAAMLDASGQPVAVPGKPLPPTPIAPTGAATSMPDPGATPAVPATVVPPARPVHPAIAVPGATTVIPDSHALSSESPDDGTPETATDPAPAAPQTPIPAALSPDAMAVMPAVVPPLTQADPAVSTRPGPESPVAVAGRQRNGATLPAADGSPFRPLPSIATAPELVPPRSLGTAAAPSTVSGAQATGERREGSTRADGAPARVLTPVTLVAPQGGQSPAIAAGAAAPAFRLFAEAIHTARRDERTGDPLVPVPATIIDPASADLAAAGGATLDMTDRRWPHAMVDRIVALRDAAGAAADLADTNIRLVPPSLGTIDVSVRRDGDTVHVHFAAEQAATRALLTDAQQRLAEFAEARGLKLGQASVGGGPGQQPQRQPTPQPANIPASPARAGRDHDPELATTRVA